MNINPSRPPIVVGSRDFMRLEQLIDAPALRQHPAALALMGELNRARVVAPEKMPADVVTMNSTVICIDEISGAEHALTLSYPNEASVVDGRVSVLAPVGSALLGLAVGQSIDWDGPGGHTLRLRVAALQYQPEAAGDFLR